MPNLSLANGHDGRLLLTCYAGCSFREIIQALRRISLLGKQAFVDKIYDYTLSFSKQFCADLKRAKQKAERAKAIWQQSQPIKDTLAETYLRKRGITCELPADLRFHDKCHHPLEMTLPALVALVKEAGSFAIHRTFLQANGCKTDQKPADDGGRKASFTLAARVYSLGFEVFIMQAPNALDFKDFPSFQKVLTLNTSVIHTTGELGANVRKSR